MTYDTMANTPVSTRGVNNTAFNPNADITSQITGTGNPVPGTINPTFASTISLNTILQYSRFVQILGVSTVSATTTITTGFVATPGGRLAVQLNASASGTVTATFSTGFKATGTLAATSSTRILIDFVSDGTTWNEVSRTTAALS